MPDAPRDGEPSAHGEPGDADGASDADGTSDASGSDGAAEPLKEVIHARGHENVSAEHASTFEVTSDDWLTPAGDCILAVEADRTPADFDPEFATACRNADAEITVTVEADGRVESVSGRGDPALTFESDRSTVGRTSDYVDDRTALVGAEAAAADLDRELVAALADGAEATVTLTVE